MWLILFLTSLIPSKFNIETLKWLITTDGRITKRKYRHLSNVRLIIIVKCLLKFSDKSFELVNFLVTITHFFYNSSEISPDGIFLIGRTIFLQQFSHQQFIPDEQRYICNCDFFLAGILRRETDKKTSFTAMPFFCLFHTVNKNDHSPVHLSSRFNATTYNFSHHQTALLHSRCETTGYDLPCNFGKIHSQHFAPKGKILVVTHRNVIN